MAAGERYARFQANALAAFNYFLCNSGRKLVDGHPKNRDGQNRFSAHGIPTSLMALAEAMRPNSKGSSTMGIKNQWWNQCSAIIEIVYRCIIFAVIAHDQVLLSGIYKIAA